MPPIIMNRARTYRYTRMRRWVERSNDTETLPLRPFCRGCIIATRGYDFRKGQARGNSRPYRNPSPSPTVFLSTKPLHRPAAAPRPFGDLFEDEARDFSVENNSEHKL